MLQSMETVPHVLVIDDDREIRDLLARFLEKQQIRVTAVRDGKEARRAWTNGHYQLVVLDLMLPGESGLDLARWLRGQSDVPIVMLTAMGEETDRIIGLELGADDYMPKPFNPRELLARIRAILRRSGNVEAPAAAGDLLIVSGLELDTAGRVARCNGALLDLTDIEFGLLQTLMRSAGEVVAREQLAEAVLGRKFHPFDRSLDMHVSRLRHKLDVADNFGDRVKTIRGVGYQLAVPAQRKLAGER